MIGQSLLKILNSRVGSRPAPSGSLHSLLSRANFKLVDIGARGGAMPQLSVLAPFSHYFACEPDGHEAQRLNSLIRDGAAWKDVTVFSEAIASTGNEATLHICKQPGLSSLLRPNLDVTKKFYDDDRYDICNDLVVPTISLDCAAKRYGFEDACFLKLDTQGTELDILRSGAKLLSNAVIGVHVEVEFHTFYHDQPLFADVDTYLRSQGFSLFDLQRTLIRRASYRSDLYSRRQVGWAEALYFHEPSDLNISDDFTAVKCAQLLGLVIAFEQFDLAFELITSGVAGDILQKLWGANLSRDIANWVKVRTRASSKTARHKRQRPRPLKFMYTDRKRI